MLESAPDPRELSWKDYYSDISPEEPPSPEIVESYNEEILFVDCNLREILLKTNLPSTETIDQNLFCALGLFLAEKIETLFKARHMPTCALPGKLWFTQEFSVLKERNQGAVFFRQEGL